jgi:hypothetical protein
MASRVEAAAWTVQGRAVRPRLLRGALERRGERPGWNLPTVVSHGTRAAITGPLAAAPRGGAASVARQQLACPRGAPPTGLLGRALRHLAPGSLGPPSLIRASARVRARVPSHSPACSWGCWPGQERCPGSAGCRATCGGRASCCDGSCDTSSLRAGHPPMKQRHVPAEARPRTRPLHPRPTQHH